MSTQDGNDAENRGLIAPRSRLRRHDVDRDARPHRLIRIDGVHQLLDRGRERHRIARGRIRRSFGGSRSTTIRAAAPGSRSAIARAFDLPDGDLGRSQSGALGASGRTRSVRSERAPATTVRRALLDYGDKGRARLVPIGEVAPLAQRNEGSKKSWRDEGG